MVVLLTLVSLLIIAFEVTLRFAPTDDPDAPGPLERATLTVSLAIAAWLASSWILAVAGVWTAEALTVRAAATALAAAFFLFRRLRRSRRIEVEPRAALWWILASLPVLVWCVFILWRGVIVPPVSHDALSYHLPKAVLFARAEGFDPLRELDPRQSSIPANYEVLLTDLVITQQEDTYTEWPSALFYLLFIVASGAIVERWWGARRHQAALAVMLMVAAVPVLLLHSGAHKNDTMTAAFMVAAMLGFGRWTQTRQSWALLFLMLSVAAATGTKPQAAGLALFMAPFILIGLMRRYRGRPFLVKLCGYSLFGAGAFLLLGGVVFVSNFLRERAAVGRFGDQAVIMYGDWSNLWQGPYVLLAAPFSRSATALSVPWESAPWFWQRYEIYFSHLGIPFALCAVACPVAMFLLRRTKGASERRNVTLVATGAFLLMLPVVFLPHGMYAISLPRYALFLVPLVFAWTVAPLAMRSAAAAFTLLVVAGAAFVAYAVDNAKHDAFAPLDYVLWARERPGTRHVPFDSGRAASVVDKLAGPDEKIALDVAYASWIHPVFGSKLNRPVFFIQPGDGPAVIPEDVRWVAIDRAWGIFWGAALDGTLSDARQDLSRGQPSPEELRVRRQLLADPRFRLAYVQRGRNQVVFERIR